MKILRNVYLNRLIAKMHNGMIKVITGIRRCGKSYLLFELFYKYLLSQGVRQTQIIRVALDDIGNRQYCNPEVLYDYLCECTADTNTQYYILLDEVQLAISKEELHNRDVSVRLYGVLNGLLRRRNVDVYVTGSNSKLLSSDVMTEFRGRGDEVHIAPLSFSEYYPAHGGSKYEAWQDYLLYGGFPHILQEPDDASKINYLRRLHSEIFLKDIQERYRIAHGAGMDELLKVIASSVGSLTNPQKIANTFVSSGMKGITAPTISGYLSCLRDAFVIQKADRYDIKGRKYISTPSKYYYADVGLRNAVLNNRQFEETHLTENVIYNELIFRGYNVDVGIVAGYDNDNGRRMRKQYEVDFVANRGSRRYYIQSAFSVSEPDKMAQELASLTRIPDSFRKLVIVGSRSPLWRNEQGIIFMNGIDFLLDDNSLDK